MRSCHAAATRRCKSWHLQLIPPVANVRSRVACHAATIVKNHSQTEGFPMFNKRFIQQFLVGMLLLLTATGAFAQATRTWISGVGDDVNPCSRTAPCKTFAGAISKT